MADTPEERIKGLSGRKELPENEGLLFVYDEPGFYGIWMNEMEFPIDVIWINEKGIIVDIKKDAKPESFPEVFEPVEPAQYILEVNAGFVDNNRIKIGDGIEWK